MTSSNSFSIGNYHKTPAGGAWVEHSAQSSHEQVGSLIIIIAMTCLLLDVYVVPVSIAPLFLCYIRFILIIIF